ncbi:hypothetical protein [Bradyrhizobium sp. ORS 285]|uniref:hypothetical protein n=1 Tax=Bradyrhizobium sp. ORS 285 TaxID=115808 RepID=UPI0011126A2D|nr:hypothetical protein [Bradyrhizobium sp. ORS 285]
MSRSGRLLAFNVRVFLALLLTASALPALADGERVIAVPDARAMTSDVGDDAARLTAQLRQRLQAVPSLRIVDGPPILSANVDRVPDFRTGSEMHVDLMLLAFASRTADGRRQFSLRLWDTEKHTQVMGQTFVYDVGQQPEAEIAEKTANELAAVLQ